MAQTVELSYRLRLSEFGLIPVALLLAACGGSESPQGIDDGPCPGESGFGARVEYSEENVDICVADDYVRTVFTYQGWYEVDVSQEAPDGTVYEFSMIFPHHSSSRKLNLTGDLVQARSDPNGAWIRTVVIPAEGPVVRSTSIVSGTFRLGYSDTRVVAGLFENLELDMEFDGTEAAAGTQLVPEGFFSILTDIDESATGN